MESPQPSDVAAAEFSFGIREGGPDDLDFITDSWRRSYDGGRWTRCPNGLRGYIATQQQVIGQCLKTSRVIVAYPETPERVPSQIMGYLCYRDGAGQRSAGFADVVVHYVYVKAPFRGNGIARAMFDHLAAERTAVLQIYSTHLLPATAGSLNDLRIRYNPALIFSETP